MEREELEQEITSLPKKIRRKIEAAPLASFLIGFVLGGMLVGYPSFIITLLVLSVLAVFVYWLMSDSGKKEDKTS